jgi:hypothetical protein
MLKITILYKNIPTDALNLLLSFDNNDHNTTAVEIKNSLDNEIAKRVALYRSGNMKTTPFMDGLDSIREKLVSQL